MDTTLETRYRLRHEDEVVGYARKIGSRSHFYSRDQFWWSGVKIEHNKVDESVGLFDIDKRMLYEWDIVEYCLEDRRDRMGAFLWSSTRKEFCIVDLDELNLEIPLEVDGLQLFQPKDLRFRAYLFQNPDLMVELGVDDQ